MTKRSYLLYLIISFLSFCRPTLGDQDFNPFVKEACAEFLLEQSESIFAKMNLELRYSHTNFSTPSLRKLAEVSASLKLAEFQEQFLRQQMEFLQSYEDAVEDVFEEVLVRRAYEEIEDFNEEDADVGEDPDYCRLRDRLEKEMAPLFRAMLSDKIIEGGSRLAHVRLLAYFPDPILITRDRITAAICLLGDQRSMALYQEDFLRAYQIVLDRPKSEAPILSPFGQRYMALHWAARRAPGRYDEDEDLNPSWPLLLSHWNQWLSDAGSEEAIAKQAVPGHVRRQVPVHSDADERKALLSNQRIPPDLQYFVTQAFQFQTLYQLPEHATLGTIFADIQIFLNLP